MLRPTPSDARRRVSADLGAGGRGFESRHPRPARELLGIVCLPTYRMCATVPKLSIAQRGLAGVEERVHDFGTVGKGGPDLVTVHAFGDAGAAGSPFGSPEKWGE